MFNINIKKMKKITYISVAIIILIVATIVVACQKKDVKDIAQPQNEIVAKSTDARTTETVKQPVKKEVVKINFILDEKTEDIIDYTIDEKSLKLLKMSSKKELDKIIYPAMEKAAAGCWGNCIGQAIEEWWEGVSIEFCITSLDGGTNCITIK